LDVISRVIDVEFGGKMRGAGKLAIVAACAASVLSVCTARGATLLYQWDFDEAGGAGTLVNPVVTPNSLASDGGVLTMAQAGGTSTFTPHNLFTAGGGGVSGLPNDYGYDNSASVSNNSNPGGIAYSTGAAATNNPNTLNAMPSVTQYTMTMWIKPTAAELSTQSRLFQIGTATGQDESSSQIWVALNAGKIQTGGGSASDNSNATGNTLIANAWNFVAVEVDLTASNVYYDTSIRTATGNAESDSMVLYQGDSTSNTYGYTSTQGFANGTTSFASQGDYVQLLNRTASSGNRAFQGQGDDFRVYNGLLSTSDLQGIVAADTGAVPEPTSLAGLWLSGLFLLRRRKCNADIA
jgi:hypothetical protein